MRKVLGTIGATLAVVAVIAASAPSVIGLADSTARAGSWTPEATSASTRKASQDESTAAYVGEFYSGASAVSTPILNEAGVPQISPANTYVGLTSGDRQSVLGTYSIDENGDTTLTDHGIYAVNGGSLTGNDADAVALA